jgi:hypothetical protein
VQELLVRQILPGMLEMAAPKVQSLAASRDFGHAARLTRGVAGRFREKRQLHCELVPAAPCALISAS